MFYCSICFYLLTNQFLGSDGSSNKLENNKVSKALFSEYHMQSRKRGSECCHPENPCAMEPMEPVASSSKMAGICSATACASASNECTQWCLEAILLPLQCFSLQRQGSYQLNQQTPESKHVFSIFFHGYGSLQYTVGWDV